MVKFSRHCFLFADVNFFHFFAQFLFKFFQFFSPASADLHVFQLPFWRPRHMQTFSSLSVSATFFSGAKSTDILSFCRNVVFFHLHVSQFLKSVENRSCYFRSQLAVKDSGKEGDGFSKFSRPNIDSYISLRPSISSDLIVNSSCNVFEHP